MTATVRRAALVVLSVAGLALGGFIALAGDGPKASPESSPRGTAVPRSSAPQAAPTPQLDYYVAPDGDDRGSGTAAEPLQTLSRAVELAPPGSTIHLAEGTYDGAEIRTDRLTLSGADGLASIVKGPIQLRGVRDVVIEGLVIEGVTETYHAGLLVEDSERITISGNLVRGNSFGIHLMIVEDVLIEANEVTDNAYGIEVHRSAPGTVIRDNRIHHNNRELDAARRRGGVNFYYTTGGVTLADNELINNGAVAVEIFGASDLTIVGNLMTGSADLIETGTGDGTPCRNLTIIRNVGYRADGDRPNRGFYLRCASDSLVAHNTLDGLDKFAIGIHNEAPNFGGTVEGLRVVNNVLSHGRAFSIDSVLPEDVVIDHNLIWPTAGPQHGNQVGWFDPLHQATTDARQFTEWTGYQRNGIVAEPMFVSRDDGDYRLRRLSPAVDAGVLLGAANDEVTDGAPDIGRFEYGGELPSPAE